jgi:hypothetical protein
MADSSAWAPKKVAAVLLIVAILLAANSVLWSGMRLGLAAWGLNTGARAASGSQAVPYEVGYTIASYSNFAWLTSFLSAICALGFFALATKQFARSALLVNVLWWAAIVVLVLSFGLILLLV